MKYPEDEEAFNHITNMLNAYIDKVIKPLLPEFMPDITGSAFFGGDKPTHGHISTSAFNSSLKESDYYFNETPFLIHFTSVENAISIISEGHIRLVALNKSTDKNELHYAANDIWPGGLKTLQSFLPSRFLNISMCIYEPDKMDSELFDLWRFYGRDGHGIGIVFEFDYSNLDDWYRYHLSKVHYGDTLKNQITEIVAKTKEWSKKNQFEIENFHEILLPLYSFHKVGHFKTENEVRLVKRPLGASQGLDLIPGIEGYTVNDFGSLVNFEKLYFKGKKRDSLIASYNMPEEADLVFNKQMPKFKVKEIILGHAIGREKAHELKGVLTAFKALNGYNYEIKDSVFK